MPRTLTAVALLGLLLAGPGHAQGLLQGIKDGAKKAGDAVTSGAEAVGNTVSKGADAVEETFTSTEELFSEEDTPAQTRAKLDAMADSVLNRLLVENAAAEAAFQQSAGYAIFDSRSITVFPVRAGFGRGVAVNKSDGARTYMRMGTGGVGAAFGIGGFASQFVIFFETEGDFISFVVNGYEATAEGGAKVGTDETQETARFIDGRTFFVLGKKGWRVNASATGTKYWLDKELN